MAVTVLLSYKIGCIYNDTEHDYIGRTKFWEVKMYQLYGYMLGKRCIRERESDEENYLVFANI